MALQRMFQPGEQLTADDVNQYMANRVPQPGMVFDTGWIDFSAYLEPGLQVSHFRARRVGCTVEIRAEIVGGFPTNDAFTVTGAALPAQWRPDENSHGSAWFTGGYPGSAWIRGDGTVAVVHRAGSDRNSVQFTIRYFVD